MKAVLKGQFLKLDSYHSEKKGVDIPVLVLFDGADSIRVDNVPLKEYTGFKMGDTLTVPIRVYNSQFGLRVMYDA